MYPFARDGARIPNPVGPTVGRPDDRRRGFPRRLPALRLSPAFLLAGTLAATLAGGWAGVELAPRADGPAGNAGERLFVIPNGTAAAAAEGRTTFRVPAVLELRAGQVVAVRNEDDGWQYFMGLPVAAGQTVRKRFDEPGRFRYGLTPGCSVDRADDILVVVADRKRS